MSPGHKRLCCTAAVLTIFFISGQVHAQQTNQAPVYTPPTCWHSAFAVDLFPYVGTSSFLGAESVRAVTLNLVGGYSCGVEGFEFGTLFNIDSRAVEGFQIGGGLNLVGTLVHGVQIGGLLNVVGHDHWDDESYYDPFEDLTTWVLQIAGLVNHNNSIVDGLQLAGIANIRTQHFTGVQVAAALNFAHDRNEFVLQLGAVNISMDDMAIQVGVIDVAVEDVEGMQLGAVNVSGDELEGLQLGGVNVNGEETEGVQLGGVNVTGEDVDGVQIGIVNVAERADYQLGALSLMWDGRAHVDLWATESGLLLSGLRHGGDSFHNIYGVGVRPGEQICWALVLGHGIHIPISGDSFLDIDALFHHLNEGEAWTADLNLLSTLRVVGGWRIEPRLALLAGLSFNVLTTRIADGVQYPLVGEAALAEDDDLIVRGWPGLVVGVQFF